MHGYQYVDAIGVEAVTKLILQSKLCKFVIYRQGSGKGSIPVFECISTDSVHRCVQAFKDWADTINRMNPYNTIPYDILLYQKNISDGAIENDSLDDEESTGSRTKKKVHKIKISFALNSMNGMGGMNQQNGNSSVSVEQAVANALEKYDQARKIKDLEKELKDLKENGNDDDDDDQGINRISQITSLLKEIRLNGKAKSAAAIAGDDDDDLEDDDELIEEDGEDDDLEEDEDDDDLEEEEEEPRRSSKKKKTTSTSSMTEEKRERLKTAIRVLYKYDSRLDEDLLKLAKLAKNNTPMFKTVLSNLRSLKI